MSGDGKIKIEKEYDITPGAEYSVLVGKTLVEGWSFWYNIIEVATGDFDEEDIIRYEDKYGRA